MSKGIFELKRVSNFVSILSMNFFENAGLAAIVALNKFGLSSSVLIAKRPPNECPIKIL